MSLKFKLKPYSKVSKAVQLHTRKRCVRYALITAARLGVRYGMSSEELAKVSQEIKSEISFIKGFMDSSSHPRYPRKQKKRYKQYLCDVHNSWIILPEVIALILYPDE